ncbi:signal transduction histidine kinase [Methanohalophilus levihalophilus]|uniref:sensor histidine kinase n=1 Tax=Methanohalophilus levihalophilus TaxID=1431282 RepID=UPI001FD8ABF2|nr:ATP-binding protein [Methanohalophilus levihalophilus]MBP2030818.1 signal transduction histidine kinase [Methanohalophilus levihalophilus]
MKTLLSLITIPENRVLNPHRSALLGALFALILLILVWWQAGLWYEEQLLAEQRIEEAIDLSLHGNALSSSLTHRFAILEGLASFVHFDPSEESLDNNFDDFTEGLYSSTEGILYFSVAPAGIQKYVYPISGNEDVLGYDLINDEHPDVRTDVQRAIQTRQIALSGPYELQSDIHSMVAIKPIYINDTFWGLAVMAVDMSLIIEEAGLMIPGHPNIAIRDDTGNVFYGGNQVYDSDPVIQSIELPDGNWELGIIPTAGHTTIQDKIIVFKSAGLIIVVLLTMMAYMAINRQKRLTLAVKESTKELSKANEELVSLTKMKDLFTDIMRHDLLNPANIVRGFTDVLLDMENDEKKNQALQTIKRNNEKLIDMIESASKFSKLESVEELEFEETDIRATINEVIENFKPQLEEKQMLVEFAAKKEYNANANPMIEEVFANLISNAIKYSPSKSKIIIDVLDSEDYWKIKVTDFGEGIADEDKPKLFERFKRVDKSGVKGTGLGLAIVKRITNLHGGNVGIENNPAGQGSVFWVTVKKSQ